MSRLSGIKRLVGLGLNKPINPLTALIGAKFGGELAGNIRDDFSDRLLNIERAKTAALKKRRIAQSLAASIARQNEMTTSANLNFLRQNAPEVHDAVLAGRRLPQDAVVLGGTPRQDLLSELARNMQAPQPNPNNPF